MNEEKEIIEIKTTKDAFEEPIEVKVAPKKTKRKFKINLKNLTKKQKIIILAIALILIFVIALLTFYLLTKDKDSEVKKEPIVIEKDNYRYQDGYLYFLNASEEEIGEYECINKFEDKCMVAYFSNEDDFNQTIYKYTDESEVFISSYIYNNNFVFVFDNMDKDAEEIKLYDISKKEIIDTYKLVKRSGENTVILKNETDEYGLINLKGEEFEEIISFKYKYLGKIANKENYIFETEKEKGLLDSSGKVLINKIKNLIVDYNDTYIVSKNGDNYFLYDYQGKEISSKSYDYIGIQNQYITFVNDELLYIKDEELNKINEEGLELKNKYYNPIYYFDKEVGSKVEEKRSFSLNEENGELIINIEEAIKKFNIYESKLNQKYNYVNYLNGTIYIYNDLEKEDVFGKYDCVNKNIVKKDTVEFDNCFIAKETKLLNRQDSGGDVSYLPIYNNRFIFINDKKNLALNNNIILWDMIKEKDLAKYASVDVGFYQTNNIAVAEANNLFIMAQNTNKEYGIIKMSLDAVAAIVPFQASSITYLNNNFLVKKTDGTYHLYKEDGGELTKANASIKNEIIEYHPKGYLIVKEANEKYLVYSIEGTIVSNQLKFIKLGNYFYGGINKDNELEIYSYDDSKTNIISKAIPITNNDYPNAFELTDNSLEITLKVYQTKDNYTIYKFDNTGEEIV